MQLASRAGASQAADVTLLLLSKHELTLRSESEAERHQLTWIAEELKKDGAKAVLSQQWDTSQIQVFLQSLE